MNAGKLYRRPAEGGVQALSAELRDNPADAKRRTFLFELLSFAGEYERALKQLDVLAQQGPQAEMGTLVYRSAIQAELQRQELFRAKGFPESPAESQPGAQRQALSPWRTLTQDWRSSGGLPAGTYLGLLAHIASSRSLRRRFETSCAPRWCSEPG
jgi:type VI secretion system protein ImpE